jgi:hypothetical protein
MVVVLDFMHFFRARMVTNVTMHQERVEEYRIKQ